MVFFHSLMFFLFAVFSSAFVSYGNADECEIVLAEHRPPLAEAVPAISKGEAHSQYKIGMAYAKGEGVPQNSTTALYWLQKAAESHHTLAQYELGMMYAKGEATLQNPEAALHWLEKAAKSDDISAQYELGVMYAVGEEVPQNLKKAVHWYKKAVLVKYLPQLQQHDHRIRDPGVVLVQSLAQYELGVTFAEGTGGFPQDLKLAFLFLTQSAQSGSIRAESYLRKMYSEGEEIVQTHFKRDLDNLLRKLQKIKPDPSFRSLMRPIHFHLGLIFALGLEGVPQDFGEAVRWLEQAIGYSAWNETVEVQIAMAEYIAFFVHDKGIGVPQDSEKARAFYHRAVKRGYHGRRL